LEKIGGTGGTGGQTDGRAETNRRTGCNT